ncbi:hypothetical protein ACFP2F_10980 [Hymenobacter artigasi]|uniref:Multisubunit Na+/H+ antiporter MnhE subunit n=1 Tax=Hymenobacter artigasi TaxID=2719616 RepID=A0ABX1HMW7_9BACT|nr:hypothetical protein [Hymenobacter artigasi]NKI90203.1 multisubunit Na+/H+ antiporter MnhE subunit [Hymenobacter artigasi]
MNYQFEATLVSTAKSIFGFILAFISVCALSVFVGGQFSGINWRIAGGIIAMLSSGYIAYELLKRWLKCDVLVMVNTDDITIRYINRGEEITVPFVSLASYRQESFNGAQRFYLKLINGQQLQLAPNKVAGNLGNFNGLERAVEQATANFQNENAEPIIREPGFFEKPASTIMLIIGTAIYIFFIWQIVRDNLSVNGNMIMGIGIYISYVAAWLAASKKRRNARQ